MPTLPKQTIITNINSEILDNSRMLISPYDVRHNLIDMIDSTHLFLEGKDLTTTNFATPDTRTTIAGQEALNKLYLPQYVSVDNSAFGYGTLQNNYNGGENTAIGSYAITCNVYGSGNTAVGYKSLAGNIHGDSNTAIGANALQSNKHGSNNIAIGNGAGYYHGSGIGEKYSNKFYLGINDISSLSDCPEITEGAGGTPLMYGELDNVRLGIGTKKLHSNSTLEISGVASPSLSEVYDLGKESFAWKTAWISHSLNDDIYFSGGKVGLGTSAPSGEGLVTSAGDIVPNATDTHSLGATNLKWKGHFSDLTVDNLTSISFNKISSCEYECKTLYLATSGICDGQATPCGFLDDDNLDGAGIVLVASGSSPSTYRRNYEWLFSPSGSAPNCLEDHNIYSQSSWDSNISIKVDAGNHVQTDRIIGRESLSLVSESGCFGLFFESDLNSDNQNIAYISRERHVDGTDVIQNKASGVNFLSSGVDYDVSYTSLTSGVVVGQKFVSRSSRIKQTGNVDHVVGFGINYSDEEDLVLNGQKKDRLTISSYDDATSPLDAFTLMRSNGPGLVGITDSSSNPLPNTILNIQSTGDAVVRITSPTNYDSSLQLLGRSNSATHGFDITYDEAQERTDLSVISSSTKTNVMTINNFKVGILNNNPQSELTLGGEMALAQYSVGRSASNLSGFGKLYVVDSDVAGIGNDLIFQDDLGNKVKVSPNPRDTREVSTIYGDQNGNTFNGFLSPSDRSSSALADNFRNITYGASGLRDLTEGDDNITLGYRAGTRNQSGYKNIYIGNQAGENIIHGYSNVIIGHNVSNDLVNVDMNNCILIGSEDLGGSAPPDYAFFVGPSASATILSGVMGPATNDRFLTVPDARFVVSRGTDNMTITHSQNFFGSDKVASIFNKNDSYSNNPDGGVAFTFTGADGFEKTLMTMRHHVDAMTTTPSFAVASTERPTVSVSGDINLLGGIRFSDGTSVTLESNQMDLGGSIKADSTNKRVSIGNGSFGATATLEVLPNTASERVQEWKNQAGDVVAYIDQNGNMYIAGSYNQI